MNVLKQHKPTGHGQAITNRHRSANLSNAPRGAALAVILFTALPLVARHASPRLMAGTRLRVQFDSRAGTAISHNGDGVEAELIKPVEAEGCEVLPVGTIVTGRVLEVRAGDEYLKSYPMIRLGFNRLRLPDGRTFPIEASLAELGVAEYVDSEGAATTEPGTKGGGTAKSGTAEAGEDGEIGPGVEVLSDLAPRLEQWQDFTLKKGRKAWLRLDEDLALVSSAPLLTPHKPGLPKP